MDTAAEASRLLAHAGSDSGRLSRRRWLQSAAVAGMGAALGGLSSRSVARESSASRAVDVGGRRELFVDSALVDTLDGARRVLHHPVPRELVLTHDEPWEGSGSGYHSVFRDGDRYRAFYKAWHLDVSGGRLNSGAHPLFCCTAESDDGVTWKKPELGLHEFDGSTRNNIVMVSGQRDGLHVDAGHPAVFRDENPDAAEDARYKAIVRSSKPNGLIPMKSPDGYRWSPMTSEPTLSGKGAFDSQNLAFWDPSLGAYRAYWRYFTAPDAASGGKRVRAIRTSTSADLVTWSEPAELQYVDSPLEQLYTNQVKPYHRAPHLLIGFPTRYVDRGWSPSTEALPELEHRRQRSAANQRYGTAITEALVMASRDGVTFERWNEAFLRPGPERPGTWNYGQQYVAWHAVETPSDLPGAPNELSLYAGESYWTGRGSALRRYTLRLDGFVSVNAPLSGGELVTKPLRFDGEQLRLNVATSAAGGVRVEIQDERGEPVRGLALDDCHVVFGDAVDRPVAWKDGADLKSVAGKPVRLRFELRDADLYAFRTVASRS